MTASIAVITPYCRENLEILRQCHRSVLGQDVGADHFMIADGFPRREIASWTVQHVTLPQPHADNGNTPRSLGSLLAKAEGYDFIAWLDADNWYHPGHLRSLLALHQQAGSPICSALRSFHALSGERLEVSDADEDALQHVDTSCYLIHSSSFDVVGAWLDMPREVAPICDRVFLRHILQQGRSVRSTGLRSVAFRSQYAWHYRAAGMPVPDGAKDTGFADAALEYLRMADTKARAAG